MSPRPRRSKHRDLPPNLYDNGNGDYVYRRPTDKKRIYIGRDRQRAIRDAIEANTYFASQSTRIAHIISDSHTFGVFVDDYFDEIASERDWSQITKRDYKQKLVHIRECFADRNLQDIDVLEISTFLDGFPAVQSNRYRALLRTLFQYAIGKGRRALAARNPVDGTIPKIEKVRRQRLTLQAFRAIWAAADTHQRNAFDLALHTLQARRTLVNIRRADISNEVLRVSRSKTGVKIKIHIGRSLATIIDRCLEGDLISPWLLHQPMNANKNRIAQKLAPETLSRWFMRVRDRTKLYDHLQPSERPTFHEIRSLGAHLMEQTGYDKVVIQALLGHKQARMTELYLDRYEQRWIEVTGGLEI